MALLRGQLTRLPLAVRQMADAVLSREAALQNSITANGLHSDGSLKTRYHGDYHLGQVLVTGSDFIIIDFEGEPARSFAERRAKGSPLRDVAGMLRSFSYARWSALRRVSLEHEDNVMLDDAARDWEKACRHAFLQGYKSAGDVQGQVNDDLLMLFELEKALYELRYELNNRVDWTAVPLHGILELLQSPSARGANAPSNPPEQQA